MELARPGAGGEAATLPLVSVVPVVVVREEHSAGHRPAQRLTLAARHDGAELRHQAVAPVTELIDVEIMAVPRVSCCGRLGGGSLCSGGRSCGGSGSRGSGCWLGSSSRSS